MGTVFTAGEVPTADKLNELSVGAIRCKAFLTSTLSATANNTLTVVPFTSESWDPNSMHSTGSNTSRIIAPVAGIYLVSGMVSWVSNGSGRRVVQFRLNAGGSGSGGTQLDTLSVPPSGSSGTSYQLHGLYQLAANDYVELFALQNSGGTLDVSAGEFTTWMSVTLVDRT